MEPKSFNIQQAISHGWTMTKSNFGFFVAFTIILIITGNAGSILMEAGLHGSIAWLIGFCINIFVGLATIVTALATARSEPISIQRAFSKSNKFLDLALAYIALVLVVIAGLIVFIIPGIILAIRCQFAGYNIIEYNQSPINAIKHSWHMTKGQFWHLLGLTIVAIIINILGIAALFVGIFVSLPITITVYGVVYDALKVDPKTCCSENESSETAQQVLEE